MEVTHKIENGVVILAISGRLTAENVDVLRNSFLDLFSKHRRFVFDLAKMDYLDSTGLGAIVFCRKSCDECKGTLILANLSDKPRMIFEITRANRIFDVYDSVEAAVNAARE